MNEKGNRYALSALTKQKAALAGEIASLKKRLQWAEQQLIHVDATLHLLDPLKYLGDVPPARPQKRIKLFRQGELSRMILDVLRRAKKPIGIYEITTAILEIGGHSEEARPALTSRLHSNLAYLERRGRARKIGVRVGVRWALKA